MSHIEGVEQFLRNLKAFGEAAEGQLHEALKLEFEACQREAVDLIPVDSGQGRAVLSQPEALDVVKDGDGNTWFRFGFLTPKMRNTKKRGGALHLYWVEFGTKFRPPKPAGTKRDKRGRLRKVGKGRRGSPARPAQPWFAPPLRRFRRPSERLVLKTDEREGGYIFI